MSNGTGGTEGSQAALTPGLGRAGTQRAGGAGDGTPRCAAEGTRRARGGAQARGGGGGGWKVAVLRVGTRKPGRRAGSERRE